MSETVPPTARSPVPLTDVLVPAELAIAPDLPAGIEAAWHPAVVLFLQGLWGIVFVLFGKSMVTGAEISFHLHHDRI